MKEALVYDFIVDRDNKTIHIIREFATDIEKLWQSWTNSVMLDQWWGPKPYRAETKTMDFHEGGQWLYAMVSPEGEKHWAKADFVSVEKEKSFTMRGGFSDENGVINQEYPQNIWTNKFTAKDGKVQLDILLTYDSITDLEAELEMGFKEGMTIDFEQLDELLLTI